MNNISISRIVPVADANRLLSNLPLRGVRQGQFALALLLVICVFLVRVNVGWANGVAVQVFLDHIPVKTTWDPASDGRGVAVLSANDEQVRVMAQNLPAPPNGANYYAWLEQTNGQFLPVGALLYQSDGTASLDQPMPGLPYSENFSWVLISLEMPGAVGATPSAEIALAGRLPNAEALPIGGNQVPQLLPVTGADGGVESSVGPSILLLAGWLGTLVLLFAWRLRSRQNHYVRSQIHTQESSGQKSENRS